MSLSLVICLAGPAQAAGGGWRWTWETSKGTAFHTKGTTAYVDRTDGGKLIRPFFAAGHLRSFSVHLDDGQSEPFYDMNVKISGGRAIASASDSDQDAWARKDFSGTFRQHGSQDVIVLTDSADGERITLIGSPKRD